MLRQPEAEWLATLVAERVREIRDHPERNCTLFHNPEFFRRFIFEYAMESAKNSATMQKLAVMQSSATEFSRRILRKLGIGGDGDGNFSYSGQLKSLHSVPGS